MDQKFNRWYDYDPLLLKVINMLKDYQNDLHEQAELFLKNVEQKVSHESIEKFYEMVRPINGGTRWYDKDPVISRTVELLRVVPIAVQKQVANNFVETLKNNGIDIDIEEF